MQVSRLANIKENIKPLRRNKDKATSMTFITLKRAGKDSPFSPNTTNFKSGSILKARFILLAVFCTIIIANYSDAFALPPSILFYQNVSISASANTFQLLIPFNALATCNALICSSTLNNIEFSYPNGTVAKSWLEGNVLNEQQTSGLNTAANVIFWISLNPSASGTTNVIALDFAKNTTNLLDTGATGEAPQLSSTYGQYDNGANVFNFYDNFAGNTINSAKWNVYTAASSATVTVDNGVTLSTTPSSSYYAAEIATPNSISIPTPYITEGYLTSGAAIVGDYGSMLLYTGTTSNTASSRFLEETGYELGPEYDGGLIYIAEPVSGGTSQAGTLAGTSSESYFNSIFGTSFPSTGNEVFSINYANTQSFTNGNADLPASGGMGFLVQANGATNTVTTTYLWARIRKYPPSGLMPTVTFGTIIHVTLGLTLSPNPSTYGQSITLGASCFGTTDSCAVDYPTLGTHIATGTGSATYTYNAFALGANTYSCYYANDITSGLASACYTLTVAQNTTYPFTLTNSCSSWLTLFPNSCTTTATVTTHNSQLQASLYRNGALIHTTNTQITDSISTLGSSAYVFNTLGNTNYTANSLTNTLTSYVPVTLENITYGTSALATKTLTPAMSPYAWNTPYPLEISIVSPSNQVSYTLNSVFYGNSVVTLQSSVANILYVPPANQPSGNYIFGILEQQTGGGQLSFYIDANSVDMTDMISAISYNTPIIQYYPNFADCPTWSVIPQSWTIKSDYPGNQHANQSSPCGDQFSNANMTFTPQISVTYNGFPTFILANSVNTNIITITQNDAFGIAASAAVPNTLYGRELINWETYDQYDILPINAVNTYTATLLINNYTITQALTFNSIPTNTIWIPKSAYQNPSISLNTQSSLTSATNFYKGVGNYCPATETDGTYETIQPYLVDANGSLYDFQIYQSSSYLSPNYYIIVQEGTGSGAVQVQSYQETAIPFALPLENGVPYKFILKNPSCTSTVYGSALSVWVSPISITIPANVSVAKAYNYTATANCHDITNTTGHWLLCTGDSTNAAVKEWIVTIYNASSIVGGWTIINQTDINASSFSFKYKLTSNSINYWAHIAASVGNTYDPLIVVTDWFTDNYKLNYMAAGGAILSLLFFFSFAFIGYSKKTLSLVMIDLLFFVGGILDFMPVNFITLIGLVTASGILIFLFETDRV